MPPRTQVNSATGIMGVTGSGKSSLLATLARYVYKRWGKVMRYYNSDGGGFPAEIQELQALGIMEVFRMRTRDPGDLGLSFETAYRACQGWWPRKIKPSTGEVPPGVEMVPPVALRFEMRCVQGHLVKTVPAESLLTPQICPTCRTPVTKADMQVSKTMVVNKGFEHVGAVGYDGLTSMLSWEMMELGQRAGRMELRGEEGAIGGKVSSGDLKFGGVTRSHVGFAQTRGEELVHLTLGIPNLVVPPVFTMLTHEDVDDRSLSITGPKIAGRAKTDEAPQWFGNLLECAKIPAREGSGEQRILYLSEFTDPTGRRHLCKNRAAPGTLPVELIDPPNTDLADHAHEAFTQFNLGLFFELLDAALEKGIAAAKEEFPNAPGLVDGWVEIGGTAIEPGPAVVGSQPAPGGQTLTAPGPGTTTAPLAGKPPRGGTRRAAAPPAPAAQPAVQEAPPAPPEAQPSTTAAPPPPAVVQDAGAGESSGTTAAPPSTPDPASGPPVPPPTAAPAPTPAPTSTASPRPRAAAPPAGRRPSSSAPPLGTVNPTVAGKEASAAATTPAGPTTGTPPGVPVAGPTAASATPLRPPAAAPRPPAAVPRPKPAAPPTATPVAGATPTH